MITRINGRPVATSGEVRACLEQVPEGGEVTLAVSRGSELQEVKARLEKGAASSPLP